MIRKDDQPQMISLKMRLIFSSYLKEVKEQDIYLFDDEISQACEILIQKLWGGNLPSVFKE